MFFYFKQFLVEDSREGQALPKLPQRVHFLPAHNLPPLTHVVWPQVLVFEVVGVLPHVQDQQRVEPLGQGRVLTCVCAGNN